MRKMPTAGESSMSLDEALALAHPEDSIDALADPLWHRVEDDWTSLSSAEPGAKGQA